MHEPEIRRILDVIDLFQKDMAGRMIQKFYEGKRGWDGKYPTKAIIDDMQSKLTKRMTKKHAVDLANYAMMLWYRAKK